MGDHYFSAEPGAASRPATVDLVLRDLHFRLETDRGMFSPDKVDAGTRILLDSVPRPPREGNLLDLGCGYGPISLTLAARAPEATVYGVDVNQRALALAGRNAEAAGLNNVRFGLTEEIPAGVTFAAIWSNPPIRIGKQALHDLLTLWLPRLQPGGLAHLVVQKHLGSDSLQRWLTDQGWSTTRLASRSSYRILEVQARER
ncbi:class I SAM-dependent methyltransferase [Actinocorallia longicatena]|uniref:class I SAM-dependent methyltransferase n=1 Tax=Actinocorallia longicatena TaxID=111803 RepID=UPI0031DB8A2B